MKPILATLTTLLALGPGCTDRAPGQGDADAGSTTGSTGDDASGGPTTSAPTTGGPTTGEPTTGEPTTTGESTTAAPTTGDPWTCPEAQPSLTPLWSRTLPVSEFPDIRAGHRLGVLEDGTLVIDGDTTVDEDTAPGLFRVTGDGGSAAWHPGALTPGGGFRNVGLRLAGDGSIVVLGARQVEPFPEPYIARFAADGSELARLELATTHVRRLWNFDLDGDAALVIGHDAEPGQWLARVDIATGVPAWELALPAIDVPMPGVVDVGPGGEVVAGHGSWPNFGDPEFKLWRIEGGAIAWERDLLPKDPSVGLLIDVVVTAGGEVVALTQWDQPTVRLVATALALADGSPQWELEVAVADATGAPTARRWLVDDDALTLAVVRSQNGSPSGVELHRVSFSGTHLGAAPLAADGLQAAPPRLTTARGRCGELLLFQDNLQQPWLAAFAP